VKACREMLLGLKTGDELNLELELRVVKDCLRVYSVLLKADAGET